MLPPRGGHSTGLTRVQSPPKEIRLCTWTAIRWKLTRHGCARTGLNLAKQPPLCQLAPVPEFGALIISSTINRGLDGADVVGEVVLALTGRRARRTFRAQ